MLKNTKTIIFDLDGTLLNTLDDIHLSINYALKKFGYEEHSINETRNFVGSGIQKAIERAIPKVTDISELQLITECFKTYYKDNMYAHTKPYDGIIDMLKILKQKGYKTAVLSNKYDIAVKSLVKRYFENFIDISIGESETIRRKPQIDGINKIITELNTDIKSSIFIGDSEIDIQTAKNADIPCISVLWGFKTKEFLIQNGAEYI